jgi:hypothetical protein
MDKLYFTRISDLKYGFGKPDFYGTGFNCDDYDSSDTTIDGILFINNNPIKNSDLIKMRIHEIFNPGLFKEDLKQITDAKYVRISSETSDKIYECYSIGELTSDKLKEIVEEQ